MHNLQINDLAKIEGHASFIADVVRGDVRNARVKIEEGARFLEGILRNRKQEEMPFTASRICGVCPIVHNLTAHKAIESALGIVPSEQSVILRKLMMTAQIMTSHGLHLYFFSCSDFLGIETDIELIKKCPAEAHYSVGVRDLGNMIARTIGGRSVHPLTPQIGGFRKLPSEDDLLKIKEKCLDFLPKAVQLARFFLNLNYPKFERKMKFVSFEDGNEYPIYDGKIGGRNPEVFLKNIREFQLPLSLAKRTHYEGDTYFVGALARINNNHQKLNKEAKKILTDAQLLLPVINPFYNVLAQAIEVVHCVEEAARIADFLLAKSLQEEKINIPDKNGKGFGIIEAPRGLLFYEVSLARGVVKDVNIITPTAQNLANLEKDLEDFEKLDGWKKLDKKGRKRKIAMLIRAYDPCITCATH